MFEFKKKKRENIQNSPRNFQLWMKVENRRTKDELAALVETMGGICFRCRERGRRARAPFVKRLAHCRIQARVHLTPSATSTIRESRTYVNWPAHRRPGAIDIGRTASGEILLTGIGRGRFASDGPSFPMLRVVHVSSNCSELNPRKPAIHD